MPQMSIDIDAFSGSQVRRRRQKVFLTRFKMRLWVHSCDRPLDGVSIKRAEA